MPIFVLSVLNLIHLSFALSIKECFRKIYNECVYAFCIYKLYTKKYMRKAYICDKREPKYRFNAYKIVQNIQ